MKSGPSGLQRELKQRRAFRSRQQEGVVALLRTVDLLRRSLAQVIDPHGITLQQYNVLRILRGAGDEGLPTLEIASRMVEHYPGITRLLDRLEAKKLVRRERCPQDRRQVLCHVTAAGLALLATLDDTVHGVDTSFLGTLSTADLERLIRILEDVRTAHG